MIAEKKSLLPTILCLDGYSANLAENYLEPYSI
jgi:hypothetical protein